MIDQQAVQDWLRVHRTLLDMELAFPDIALRAAQGSITAQELDEHRKMLEAAREVCAAAYRRAFADRTGQ